MKGSVARLVLWTCAGIIAAAFMLELFIPKDADVPSLSDELLLQSQALHIQLEGETGRGWQQAIHSANQGSSGELQKKIAEAMFQNNFQVACVAVDLLNRADLRDRFYDEIGNHAVEDCENLAYAILAANNIGQAELKRRLSERVRAREAICRPRSSQGQR